LIRTALTLSLFSLVAACGSSGGASQPTIAPAPVVEFQPNANGWSAQPVKEDLDEVSNNGAGYTGDIDVYALEMPADGRLQVSLSWTHDADFDLVLSSDERGEVRLAEGLEQGAVPEYIGTEVTAGQKMWIFVAGWEGDPGEYTLETILLNPGSEKFALASLTDGTTAIPRNTPIELVFTQDLDPVQPLHELVFFIGPAAPAPGHFCIDGNRLIFYPRLPESPNDENVLHPGFEYLLQFPRGARGLRAATGEYLDKVEGAAYRFSDWSDLDPSVPPRVLRMDLDPQTPWDGSPLTVELLGALDPTTIRVYIDVEGIGIVASAVRLTQQHPCGDELHSYLQVEATDALPPGRRVRVVLPGTMLRLGGTSGATGPAPAAAGDGFVIDLISR